MPSIAESAELPPSEVLSQAAHEIIRLYNLHHLQSVCNAITDAFALGIALMLEGPEYAIAVFRAGLAEHGAKQHARDNARALVAKYPIRFEQEPV